MPQLTTTSNETHQTMSCFRTKAQNHRTKINDLKQLAFKMGWKPDTLQQTIGLNYSPTDIDDLGQAIGSKPHQVEILHQIRLESKRELAALLTHSELNY